MIRAEYVLEAISAVISATFVIIKGIKACKRSEKAKAAFWFLAVPVVAYVGVWLALLVMLAAAIIVAISLVGLVSGGLSNSLGRGATRSKHMGARARSGRRLGSWWGDQKVLYSSDGTPTWIGTDKVATDSDGTPSWVGSQKVDYDAGGNVISVGEDHVTYGSDGTPTWIGDRKVNPTGAAAKGAIMVIELAVPDDWTPGQALLMRQLLQQVVGTGQPIITAVRRDVTADQLKDMHDRIEALIREAGLQAA